MSSRVYGELDVKPTRFNGLGYAKIKAGVWQFVCLFDRPAQTGPHYASATELLADADRFASAMGYRLP